MTNIKATTHSVVKGRILKMIAAEYPGGADFFVLWQVLNNLNIAIGRSVLRGYLVYLEEVGYVRLSWKTDADGEKFITVAVATTKGLNFIDGVLPEPDLGVTRIP